MRARQENTDDFKELMARTLFGLGKYDDSERLFNELIDHDPFQKRYWNALASTQFMKEDYSASVTSSEYAIAIDPDDPDAVVSKANGLYRLENYEQALTYFERYSREGARRRVRTAASGHLPHQPRTLRGGHRTLQQGRDWLPTTRPTWWTSIRSWPLPTAS